MIFIPNSEKRQKKSEEENELLKRFSFTLPPNLIELVDQEGEQLKMNRSMIVREAITQWFENRARFNQYEGTGIAIMSYIFDHHDNRVRGDILEVQHHHNHDEKGDANHQEKEPLINSSIHIHLTHDKCFEVAICRGDLKDILELTDKMRGIKGVQSFSEKIFPIKMV